MKNFLKKLVSDKGEISSKRFTGILGYFSVVVVSLIIVFVKSDISTNELTLLTAILYTSAALLGITSINAFSKNGNRS